MAAANINKSAKLKGKLKKKTTEFKVTSTVTEKNVKAKADFHHMGIDDRILEGVAKMKWEIPTLVQERAIPFVMEGKSVVVQARTGSGKTGAFLIPILHRALAAKAVAKEQTVRVLVLAPSKELCRQISEMAQRLAIGCSREVRVLDLSPQMPLSHQRPFLAELPDVVVGPPGRVLSHIQAGHLSLHDVQSVVVDEADLMMAYQHSDSLKAIWSHLPEYYQCFITSATLGNKLKRINTLLLHNDEAQLLNTVILKLKDVPLPTQTQLTQYVMKIEEFEKTVLLYALYRLNMMSGKTIIFVNSVNKGYKLRMFLGQFGIASCILNCELPGASRCDIIEQFNAGRYDTIIATDETSLDTKTDKLQDVEVDLESGASRGLDFQFVTNIINFDFPLSVQSYIHRVGRTARGNNQGTALSMVSIKENEVYETVAQALNHLMNRGKPVKGKTDVEGVFKNYVFDLNQLDGFSYRARDVWRMCTNHAVMETRKKEIAQQLLNSKKLQVFFHDNPHDRALLKHDKKAHGITTQHHLKHVPDYIVPEKLRASGGLVRHAYKKEAPQLKRLQKSGRVEKRNGNNKINKGLTKEKVKLMTSQMNSKKKKKADPLRCFAFTGFQNCKE